MIESNFKCFLIDWTSSLYLFLNQCKFGEFCKKAFNLRDKYHFCNMSIPYTGITWLCMSVFIHFYMYLNFLVFLFKCETIKMFCIFYCLYMYLKINQANLVFNIIVVLSEKIIERFMCQIKFVIKDVFCTDVLIGACNVIYIL